MTNHRRIESKKKKIKVETASIVPGTPVDSFRVIGCCDFRSKKKTFLASKGYERGVQPVVVVVVAVVAGAGERFRRRSRRAGGRSRRPRVPRRRAPAP